MGITEIVAYRSISSCDCVPSHFFFFTLFFFISLPSFFFFIIIFFLTLFYFLCFLALFFFFFVHYQLYTVFIQHTEIISDSLPNTCLRSSLELSKFVPIHSANYTDVIKQIGKRRLNLASLSSIFIDLA